MVGGRFCKTAVISALLSVHISRFFNLFKFLEILILFDFFNFYFSAKDISLNI